jgi:hypothetical protein
VGRSKGISLVSTVRLLRKHRARAAELLPPHLHHYLNEWIQVSAWYPTRDLAELASAVAKIVHPDAPDVALEQMGAAGARIQPSIYRDLLIGAGSTSRTFALWSTQHDTGELRRTREGPERARFELVDFADSSREFCLILAGYLKGALEINDMTDASVDKVSCRLWGDASCAWIATWKRKEA